MRVVCLKISHYKEINNILEKKAFCKQTVDKFWFIIKQGNRRLKEKVWRPRHAKPRRVILKSAKICLPEGNNYCLSLAWIPCKSSSLDKCSSIHIIINIMKPLWNKWLRQVKFVCFIHSTHASKLGKEESGKNHMTSTALMSPLRHDQSIDV